MRAVLYQRVLDANVEALKPAERAALEMACAALADLSCEMRPTP